jgi:hypothetical protein
VSAIRLTGSTSGYAEITPSAVAGDVQLVLPSTAGTLDRLNRAGNILQVVSTNFPYNAFTTTTSTSFVSTDITASIAPTQTSSTIQVFVSTGCYCTGVNASGYLSVYRGATNLGNASLGFAIFDFSAVEKLQNATLAYKDSPNTTSSTAYTVYARTTNASSTFYANINGMVNMTLIEVAA